MIKKRVAVYWNSENVLLSDKPTMNVKKRVHYWKQGHILPQHWTYIISVLVEARVALRQPPQCPVFHPVINSCHRAAATPSRARLRPHKHSPCLVVASLGALLTPIWCPCLLWEREICCHPLGKFVFIFLLKLRFQFFFEKRSICKIMRNGQKGTIN